MELSLNREILTNANRFLFEEEGGKVGGKVVTKDATLNLHHEEEE